MKSRSTSLKAKLKRLLLGILLGLALLWGGGILLFSFMPVPFSAVMAERQVSAWLSGDVGYVAHSDWVGMDEISPWMGLAVIAAEDQTFPTHWGFDVDAIQKAVPITSVTPAGSAARLRSRSRRRKTSSFGMDAAGCVKDSRPG